MDNQHRKISGYRELNEAEIALMNHIKAKGAELLELHAELMVLLANQRVHATDSGNDEEVRRLDNAEPMRWANIGKTDIQTGLMALTRAVAQPAGV